MRLSPLLILFLLFSSTVLAQQPFSGSTEDFPKEVEDEFKRSSSPDLVVAAESLVAVWEEGGFSTPQKEEIVKTLQLMYKERAKHPAVIEQYFKALLAFHTQMPDSAHFYNWHSMVPKVMAENKRELNDLNAMMEGLFTKLAFYDSRSKMWKLDKPRYELRYDKEPVVVVTEEVNLVCLTQQDTLTIYGTKGEYRPFQERWTADGGRVYWTRFNLPADIVRADLPAYTVDVTQSSYEADSVTFIHRKFFSEPTIGRLEDHAYSDYKGLEGSYPRFTAYDKDFVFDDLAENIIYRGGFRMEGPNLMGVGTEAGDAVIELYYKDRLTAKAVSSAFILDPKRLRTDRARTTIYLEEDSIYHPQLEFQYLPEDQELTVMRKNEGLYQAPFFNSYHGLEMYFEGIIWKINEPLIHMTLITNPEGEAIFESTNYFRDTRYSRIQSVLDYNPLAMIKSFADRYQKLNFELEELAHLMGGQPQDIERLIVLLSNEGYLYYDSDNGTVILKEKLIHYVNAHKDREDYDVIRFRSVITARSNATLSLETFNLDLEGVPTALLSDSQSTWIVPHDQKLTIKENLEMEFDGHVHSGRFDFFGSDFRFDYGQFKVDLDDVDSVRFVFPEVLDNGMVQYRQINTVLQDVNGALYIDQPYNKSGRKEFSEYPIFDCNKNAFVYYDAPSIHGGVYNRDEFHFNIDPFVIDSLDNFAMAGLELKGTLNSADIIPEIESELQIMPDYSLGLVANSPEGGWPLYGGKGTGTMQVNLSNQGFRAKGGVDYLASNTTSTDIIFFPDSMHAEAEEFTIPEPGEGKYPRVAGVNVSTRWMPHQDTMHIDQNEVPFTLYKENIIHHGSLVLTPERLAGKGEFYYKRGFMGSPLFAFYRKNITAEKASLKIHIPNDSTQFAFSTPDVEMDLNLPGQYLTATSNTNKLKTEMPVNKYATNLQEIRWNLPQEEVLLERGANQTAQQARFMALPHEQDSLNYQVGNARVDLLSSLIKAEEVPVIHVADSRVYPDSQLVYVQPGAKMVPLANSELITDTIHENHRLYDAHINVLGRLSISGRGTYDYRDANEKVYKIRMEEIKITEEQKTAASGNIVDTATFRLSDPFDFKGQVALLSTNKYLNFNGFVMPEHPYETMQTTWFRYENPINPDSIYFVVDTALKSENRLELFAGAFLNTDSAHVYNVFAGRKKQYSDNEIFRAEGLLYFDDLKKTFIIADSAKLSPNGSLEGKYWSFNPQNGAIYAEGPMEFASDLRAITTQTAGTMTFSPRDSIFLWDVVMKVNFPWQRPLYKLMEDSINIYGAALSKTRTQRNEVEMAFAELIDDEKTQNEVLQYIRADGTVRDVKELESTMLFTDLKLTWNPKTQTFQSVDEVGLANLGGTPINKRFTGAIEIDRARAGDKFTLLLESRPGQYYFFYYYYGNFYILSGDDTFNLAVREASKKLKEPKFRVREGTKRQIDLFRRDLEI